MKTFIQPLILMLLVLGLTENAKAQCNGSNSPITLSYTVVTPGCNANGEIDLTVTGAVGPCTYAWRTYQLGTLVDSTQNLTNADAGIYTVTVIDSTGNCGTLYYVPLASPFTFSGSTTPDHCPAHDGTATVSPIGGNIPYSYLWSTGGTSQTITNLIGGNYVVTITDATGCRVISNLQDSSGTLDVRSVNNISISSTINNASCTPNTGSVTVTPSGGTAPYTYQWGNNWNGGANLPYTTATITGLVSDYYLVTVTDANGCTAGTYEYVGYSPPFGVTSTSTSENCNHSDGTATVVANGTSGPFTYLWPGGGTFQTLTHLAQGQYVVTVTDANSCYMTTTAYVNRYSPIQANITHTNQQCGYIGGSATVAPTLGTAPYTYLWSTAQTTASIGNLVQNYYTVTINDAAGCSVVAGVSVLNTSPVIANETHTDQVCNGAFGSVTLAPTGGTSPYTYLWNGGQTSSSLTNLVSGTYYYTITDATGCANSSGVYVNYNNGVSAYISNLTPEQCLTQNGQTTVTAYGGISPYTYLWNTGSTAATITNLHAGGYQVTVTGANGCSVIKSANITRSSPLSLAISVTPASCIFVQDGSATVTVSNGTAPYTYSWGNGSTSNTASNLDPQWGIGVNVTDAAGCEAHTYRNSVGFTSLSCAVIIQGRVVDDANGNCIDDAGDGVLSNTVVSCIPGYGNTITSSTGDYQLILPTGGNYALTQYAQYRNQACPVGSITLSNTITGNVYSGQNFYDWPLNVQDLRVSFDYQSSPPRPGFNHYILLNYFNDGLFNVSSGSIDFVYDPGVTYVSGATSVNTATNTATITFSNLAPGQHATALLTFTTPSSTPLGTLQTYSAHITPDAFDATPVNNIESATYEVVSSYDPNEMVVSPAGMGPPGYISENDSVLKYTIHFQNTGDFNASYVGIRDTLDDDLDITSLQPGTASHPYRWEIQDGNVLVFLFDPINLPDSSQGIDQSSGEVSYYIKQKKNSPDGTQFRAKSSIYFDFNTPVVTNGTLNTLTKLTTGLKAETKGSLNIYPNPATSLINLTVSSTEAFKGDVIISDVMGRELQRNEISIDPGLRSIPLNVQALAPGVYSIQLSNKALGSVKFVKE